MHILLDDRDFPWRNCCNFHWHHNRMHHNRRKHHRYHIPFVSSRGISTKVSSSVSRKENPSERPVGHVSYTSSLLRNHREVPAARIVRIADSFHCRIVRNHIGSHRTVPLHTASGHTDWDRSSRHRIPAAGDCTNLSASDGCTGTTPSGVPSRGCSAGKRHQRRHPSHPSIDRSSSPSWDRRWAHHNRTCCNSSCRNTNRSNKKRNRNLPTTGRERQRR